MTKDEAKAVIRRICVNLDEGLDELKQIDAALHEVRVAAVRRIAELHESGTVERQDVEQMVKILDDRE